MHDIEMKKKFIEMRAKDISFDKIASELNVGKSTLLKWSEEFAKEISSIRYIKIQSVVEQSKMTEQRRVEFLAKLIENLQSTLENTNFEGINPRDLFYLRRDAVSELNSILEKQFFYTGEEEEELDLGNFMNKPSSKTISKLNKL